MKEPRNLEARQLIETTIATLTEATIDAHRQSQAAERKARRLADEAARIADELEGLTQALDALGGPLPKPPEPETENVE